MKPKPNDNEVKNDDAKTISEMPETNSLLEKLPSLPSSIV